MACGRVQKKISKALYFLHISFVNSRLGPLTNIKEKKKRFEICSIAKTVAGGNLKFKHIGYPVMFKVSIKP